MHRTQILLEEQQYKALKNESLLTGKSLSMIIRACVTDHLDATRHDPLLDLVGVIESAGDPAPTDLGDRHDHYLSADNL